jgi:hypothetical protein
MAEFLALRLDVARGAIAVSDLALDAAVAKLDGLFGKGFAQANPALVGQYLVATAQTFQNDMADMADLSFNDDLDFDPPPDTRRRR